MLERAHVVQAVGQFDEHDADVVDHGEHHLAQVFGLLLLAGGEVDFADLGDAFDDVRHLLAEFFANVDDGDGRVFDRIVQQAGGNGDRVHLHFGEDEGDFQGMNQVRLAGGAGLAFVMLQGVVVGFLDDGEIVLRTVLLHPLHQVAELGQREGSGSDLLAQARHVGLYPANTREYGGYRAESATGRGDDYSRGCAAGTVVGRPSSVHAGRSGGGILRQHGFEIFQDADFPVSLF